MTSYQKKVLDGLWSLAVRTRDMFRCQRCLKQHDQKSKGLHAHHILTKGANGFSTRWELMNGVAVCYGCHMYLQGNPVENEKFARSLGVDYDWLKAHGKKTIKVFYEEKRQELRDIISDLNCGRSN